MSIPLHTSSTRLAYALENGPIIGTVNLSSGHDWSGGNTQNLIFSYNGTSYTVSLDAACANLAEVLTELNAEIDAAITAGKVTAAAYNTNYVQFTVDAATDTFRVLASDATTTLGMAAGASTSAYGGGNGGAEHTPTAFIAGDVAKLTVCNQLKAEPDLGLPQVEREILKPATATPDSVVIFTKGYRYKELTIEQYIQNTTWATRACAPIYVGEMQRSYVFHMEALGKDGIMKYYDICGCMLKSYEVDYSGTNDFPVEKLTFSVYDVVESVAITSLGVLLATAPSVHYTIKVTLNGDILTDCTKANLKILYELMDKVGATKYLRLDPHIISRGCEGDFTFYSDKAGLLGDELAINATPTAINEVPVILQYFSTNTITVAKMFVDDSSVGKIPNEMGLYEMNIKMKTGAANTLTAA
jgi:hypothetical protein